MSVTTYVEAIRDGLREEMQRDKSVFLIGEDVGAYGGAFKATKGLFEEFGAERVIDAPISEAAIVGAAAGAALRGLRPVAEMQFSDFITDAFTQAVNIVAPTYYRYGIPLPLVIRMPSGAGVNGGPFHSRNPEVWFAHQPGLKIICPATAYDAKGLLKTAIRDDNPVMYFEHKNLYRKIKDEVPAEEYTVPFGEARIARAGGDATVIAYGAAVHLALHAAENIAAQHGRSVEVIDLRTLVPLDLNAAVTSIKKTGRVLIAHEDNLTGGFGAEIAAQIADASFEYLDAPVRRVAAKDIPVPFAPPLEQYALPDAREMESELMRLILY